jgi:molybdate transport system substrate-binding protein
MKHCAAALLAALSLTALLPSSGPQGTTLAVAAASDLQALMPELAGRFERDTAVRVTASFGSSGNFFAQIQNGAPFDLFMSADVEYPRRLVADGHAETGSLYTYATGRIVLWTRNNSGLDVSRGLAIVGGPGVKRIAIANPRHAPYGRAAEASLRHEGLYEAARPKLVLGENVSQAAQLVESGNADVGILALSLAVAPALSAAGRYLEIPAAWHPPIEQAVVVLSGSSHKDAARQFVATLKRPDVGDLLRRFGFTAPAPRALAPR